MKNKLHKDELFFLFNQFSPSIMVGFNDFTLNLLDKEIFEIFTTAITSLQSKGFLTIGDQDQLLIISPLKKMLETITHPVHAILIGAHANEVSRVHSFHYSDVTTLVHMADCEDDHYELSVVQNREAMIDTILGFHTTSPQYQTPFEPFYLMKDTIDQARAFSKSGQKPAAIENLIAAGLEKKIAQAYTETIQSPTLIMPLLAYWHMNDPRHLQVKGFITESSPEHLWIIEIIDEDLEQVRVTHSTRSMLKSKLDTILP
jgi:hypothetical protein